MEPAAAWEAARAAVEGELGWLRTHAWLSELRLRSLRRGIATLDVGSSTARDAVSEHVSSLEGAFTAVLQRPVRVRLTLRGEGRRPRKAKAASDPQVEYRGERVNGKQQLSTFWAGPSNELPLRFAQEVISAPGTWHPLVFYGVSGSGKTHLLQGIFNGFRRRYPGRRAVYVSSERFSKQLVQARRYRHTERFRRLYRDADLLVLDDLQQLAGKRETERELNHTLDRLQTAHRQVVVACSAPPKRIPRLTRGLEGRLLGGQVVRLRVPDAGARREIIRAHSLKHRLHLEEAVVELLAEAQLDVRDLLAALVRLQAHREHVGARLDERGVRDILTDLLAARLETPTAEAVTAFVAERLELEVAILRGRSRKASVVRARNLAVGLLRDLSPLTLKQVGAYFDDRSVASVHFAQQAAGQLRQEDPILREVWEGALRVFARSK